MTDLKWRDAYNCRNPVIDKQHRHLFELAGQMETRLAAGDRPGAEAAMKALVEYVGYHFFSEEMILAQQCPDCYPAHCDEHDAIRGYLAAIWDRREDMTLEEAAEHMAKWIGKHVLEGDKDLKCHFEAAG
ncbi:MAG: bacteriohemerythrin [Actinomycetota bacterium]